MNESFTTAEHQLIGMKLSYRAEALARKISNEDEANEFKEEMLMEYQDLLGDKTINFVNKAPQYFKDEIPITFSRDGSVLKTETGFHANAITRGNPKNPGEIVIIFPGTDFYDALDRQQTFALRDLRSTDYSEMAIRYVGEVKEKYPDAQITVDGQSLGGKLAMQVGIVFPDVEVYAFNPTAIDRYYYRMLEDGKTYDNINVLIYDKEIADVERRFKYLLMFTSQDKLPFNVYHIDSNNASYRINSSTHRGHANPLSQHSTGGFRGLDGALWDVFNLSSINFTAGSSGTTPIVFDKERYVHFANMLQEQLVPYLKRAMTKLEHMEEEIHRDIKTFVDEAEENIRQVPYEPNGLYRDPRPGAIEALKDDYYRAGKYRCYDNEALADLLDSLHHTRQRINRLASTIMETSAEFEKREASLAETLGNRYSRTTIR